MKPEVNEYFGVIVTSIILLALAAIFASCLFILKNKDEINENE